jgi:hypothetical protein
MTKKSETPSFPEYPDMPGVIPDNPDLFKPCLDYEQHRKEFIQIIEAIEKFIQEKKSLGHFVVSDLMDLIHKHVLSGNTNDFKTLESIYHSVASLECDMKMYYYDKISEQQRIIDENHD